MTRPLCVTARHYVWIRTAVYLFVEPEPMVTEGVAAGGGGIMFQVSARYFQFAPSCTTTLI